MAWKRKRGKKWLVCWTSPVTGKERSRGGFVSAKDAEAFIRDEVGPCEARGLDWEPPQPPAAAEGLLTAMHAYLDYVELTLSAGTAKNRTISLELFRRFLEGQGVTDAGLDVLTRANLIAFLAWLKSPESSRRGGRSVDATRKALEHVQLFWAWCFDEDKFAPSTPQPKKLRDLRNMRSPQTPTRAPTWADADALITALAREVPGQREQRDIVGLVLTAAIERCTGLRVSQVLRLEVRDFDVATGVLTLRGELGKSKQEQAGRLMPVAPVCAPVLAALCDQREPGELLVPLREVAAQTQRKRMAEAWVAAGVNEAVWKQRTNHSLRKCFSTELARAGVDREMRDFLTGHAMGIAGIYTDPSALPLRSAVAHVAAFSPTALEAVEVALSRWKQARENGRTHNGQGKD